MMKFESDPNYRNYRRRELKAQRFRLTSLKLGLAVRIAMHASRCDAENSSLLLPRTRPDNLGRPKFLLPVD